jgi:hypothetical protein
MGCVGTGGGTKGDDGGGITGDDPPSAIGNEKALIAGCAGTGPMMDSRSAGFRVTPPAFSMERSMPWLSACAASR